MKPLNLLLIGLGIAMIAIGVTGSQGKVWDSLTSADSKLRTTTGTAPAKTTTTKPAKPTTGNGHPPVTAT